MRERRGMVNSVVGITLWTADLEGMFRFYHEIMELPLHSKHDDFIAFELGNIRINIGMHGQVQGLSADPFRIMPHFGVADILSECQRLAGQGVEFIRSPEQEHWGGWIATLKDPDGNILQLLQLT